MKKKGHYETNVSNTGRASFWEQYTSLVWAVQYAYACRGYQAIGGEYILAGLAAIFIYWLIGKV